MSMNDGPLTRRKFLKAAGAASALALGSAALGCIGGRTVDPGDIAKPSTNLTYTIKGNVNAKFAEFVPLPAPASPNLADYQVPADLSGVAGIEKADIDAAGRAALARNLFFMRPSTDDQIYEIYKRCSEAGTPAFVTVDSTLHAYHILFDYTLRRIEVDELIPAIAGLTGLMLDASTAQLDAGIPALKDLSVRNVAFFAVAQSLLGGSISDVPAEAKRLAEAELALIDAHQGFKESPIFGTLEDYSQYVPRGHYTRSDALKKYFKAMMWYGRIPFSLYRQKPGTASGIEPDKARTRQAIMIVLALNGQAFDLWKLVYDPTVFFVGESDDLSVYDYRPLVRSVYGETVALSDLTDDAKVLTFIEQAASLRPPKIISGYIEDLQDKALLKGFRFMGQRFIPDSYIFQGLVYDKVGTQADPRLFPMGLDVMGVLGSKRAYEILDGMGETRYTNYVKQFEALKAEFAALKADTWAQNLYWGWLYCLLALLNEKGDGYPTFMKRPAWVDKDLNASLGSWAELRHDTILYAKQSYTVRLTAVMPQGEARGYVEPNAELYGRLASLAKMTYDGLKARDLLNDEFDRKLYGLYEMLLKLKTIAEKELSGTSLADDDYSYIRHIGDTLESLTTFSPETAGDMTNDADKKMAVIADVHTDTNTMQVLEEAVGNPYHIFVLVPIGGRLTLTQGAAFSYYEFKQPMSDRLTDEAWQERLAAGKAPEPPAWTKSFQA